MQGPAWVALFRRIPLELHNSIALVLTTGLEVLIQSVVRLEREVAVIRGRMAGSMDAGRVILVPFDQINFLAFNKKMTEAEAQTLLGKQQPLPAAEPVSAAEPILEEFADENLLPEAAAVPEPPPGQPVEAVANDTAPANGAAPPNGAAPGAKPGQVSKSILLARLRARLAKDGPTTTK